MSQITTADEPDDAYYVRVGPASYRPTPAASGAWRRDEQHMAAISGLIAHQVALHEPRPDMQIARITFEILGVIPMVESHIEVETIRPGRTIELLEATLIIADRVIIRARAWRVAVNDTSAHAGLELTPMPSRAHCVPDREYDIWDNPGYTATIELYAAPGGRAGRRQGWVRATRDLLHGEPAHPLGTFVLHVDGAGRRGGARGAQLGRRRCSAARASSSKTCPSASVRRSFTYARCVLYGSARSGCGGFSRSCPAGEPHLGQSHSAGAGDPDSEAKLRCVSCPWAHQ